ncbi:ABC transporter ATP-binding protein [Streptomyces californicus]
MRRAIVTRAASSTSTAPAPALPRPPRQNPQTDVGLLRSIPRLDQKGRKLYAIKGLPPNLTRIPPGCAFNPRCPIARDVCRTDVPPLYEVDAGRRSACHFWKETLDAR